MAIFGSGATVQSPLQALEGFVPSRKGPCDGRLAVQRAAAVGPDSDAVATYKVLYAASVSPCRRPSRQSDPPFGAVFSPRSRNGPV